MRSLGLFLAILLGLFFEEGYRYTFLIKYIVIAISFLSFVNVKEVIYKENLKRKNFWGK
jgi:uncharacterized membrane protein YgaE (UPF0421/DUF939 family)